MEWIYGVGRGEEGMDCSDLVVTRPKPTPPLKRRAWEGWAEGRVGGVLQWASRNFPVPGAHDGLTLLWYRVFPLLVLAVYRVM